MKTNKFILVLIAIIGPLALFAQSNNSQIPSSIRSDGAAPDASAMFEVQSNTKGFLGPRMTTGERKMIASPADGLMVFDTDTNTFWYYANGGWNEIAEDKKSFNSNDNSLAIPDDDPTGVSSTITLSGGGVIDADDEIEVCVDISHSWVEDLDILLEGPDGTTIVLSDDNGLDGENYTNTCFSTEASNSITSGSAPFSGSWLPEGDFADFIGSPIEGDWQLQISDDFGGITGTLNNWRITICDTLPPTPPANMLSDGDSDTKIYLEEMADEDAIHFDANGTQRMIIEPGGDVGIGIDVPTAKLHVNGNIRTADGADIIGPNLIVGIPRLDFDGDADGILDMAIEGGGNVGVGIANPTEKLHVNGNIRVADDADLFGLDQLEGFNDLRFSGDPTGGPVFVIDAVGRSSLGSTQNFSNLTFNLAALPGTPGDFVFRIADENQVDQLQVLRDGQMDVLGDFNVIGGAKNFMLDHPLDPLNKNLSHNAVESPDYVTYYHGTVQLDHNGEAIVLLPDYFEALNKDYHYQLTCVGGYAQVYVAEEIENNRFKIAGGHEGLKVSWQVSAVRNDPWAHDHPYEAEQEKNNYQKGKYWYPEGYGQAKEMGIDHSRSQE